MRPRLNAQSIGSGTVNGAITDPSNAVVRGAKVTLANAISGYNQTVTTDDSGQFRFSNVPQNHYELTRYEHRLCARISACRCTQFRPDYRQS